MDYETSDKDILAALECADESAKCEDRTAAFSHALKRRGITIVDRSRLVNLEITERFQKDTEIGIVVSIAAGVGAAFGYFIKDFM